MSYCVNCGVELAPSEKKCPLCGVEVINPRKPWSEPDSSPYPNIIELRKANIDSHYGAILGTLLLALPAALTLLGNLIINSEISWSLYVLGACTCLFVYLCLPPLLRKRGNVYVFLCFDMSITLLYLLLIESITGTYGQWFLQLGMPLVLIVGFATALSTFVIRRRSIRGLYNLAIILPLIALALVGVEAVINIFVSGVFSLRWSLYVLSTFTVIAVLLAIIEKNQPLKDEIRRRLFV